MGKRFQLNRDGTIQYFADGGLTQPTTINSNMAQNLNSGDALQGVPGLGDFHRGVSNVAGTAIEGTGNVMKGIGSAFTAQNGYNANLAPTDYTNYGNVINAAAGNAMNGYGQFNQNLANQNQLAQALMNQSQGFGPNPALAQFHQQTANNIANQGALMAGQRGVSQNPGMMARQIAMNGANTQQNAVGQEASLQAGQQLAAQGQAAQLYGNIGNQITGQQNANTGLFTGAAGAQNVQNHGQVENYGMAQGINSQVAQNNANAVNKTTSGLMNSAGGIVSMFLAEGGEVPNPKLAAVDPSHRYPTHMLPSHLRDMANLYHPQKMAQGGTIQPIQIPGGASIPQLANGEGVDMPKMPSMPGMGGGKGGGGEEMSAAGDYNAPATMFAAKGGEVAEIKTPYQNFGNLAAPTQPLPGTDPEESKKFGKAVAGYACGGEMKAGGKVPGKPKVKGNSYKNDVVPAKLSPGEVVIPNSVMQSDDPVGNAAKFVQSIIAKHGSMGGEEDDFKSALKKAMAGRKK